MAEQNKNKAQLVKFTWIALAIEVVLIVLPFILANVEFPGGFFGFWLIGTVLVNLALAISHIVTKPKLYWLYAIVLIALPLTPILILFSALTGIEC
ncbi:hypothetical protein AM493_15845 [Flavobacterium akiainvivens]|uniref:Uncharacterized protein n=1 Tax=Flavobacterium akiainvivens TaxID=1202724 RepID=A0A0M8MJX9_9FLAO|nr:hypothetical protein [Flavobacterium akiainvivens]KOS07347.1 hypothetical protein AM493_15845 [Flavobacterium akiainvivens]SFQ46980.1 hypothetical protein SAMN05444144_105150 [Flavobacterium akiainvivens]